MRGRVPLPKQLEAEALEVWEHRRRHLEAQVKYACTMDISSSLPADTLYGHLKTELIRHTTTAGHHRLQQLLKRKKMDDHKPRDLLRGMMPLAGDETTSLDTSIREIFLQRLSQQVHMSFTVCFSESLDSLATTANKIIDVGAPIVYY
ncbi:hypothetical protein HPB49_011498 [Dermacentor silvarum]|uniref:Uncharacterized protein n=1 Tax=Dermacentor silvarum TaxID=543639 RepID=A0ACB8CEQ9_DERSI|nr:hypothetical protein HPB49_011498 [Dermacentor silvarum]